MKKISIVLDQFNLKKKIFKTYKNKVILNRLFDVNYNNKEQQCIKYYFKYGKEFNVVLPKNNAFVKDDKIKLYINKKIIPVDIIKQEKINSKIANISINDDEKLMLNIYGNVYIIEQDEDDKIDKDKETKIEKPKKNIKQDEDNKVNENKEIKTDIEKTEKPKKTTKRSKKLKTNE